MPIKPSVFRPIKSNDAYQRPFNAYKSYLVDNTSLSDSYVTQSARYFGERIDIGNVETGEGLTSLPYPTNPDGTNQYVAWRSLDHRFYKTGENNNFISEHALSSNTKKHLFVSASTLAIPYNDVGERIKRDTVVVSSRIGSNNVTLRSDKYGNLRDPDILTSSFATASRNIFYMSFNDLYRGKRLVQQGTPLRVFTGRTNIADRVSRVSYKLVNDVKFASVTGSALALVPGVTTSGSSEGSYQHGKTSGHALHWSNALDTFNEQTYVRVPHDELFDRFNRCDDWTISFWHKNDFPSAGANSGSILTKHSVTSKFYNDGKSIKTRDVHVSSSHPAVHESYKLKRTPFAIGHVSVSTGTRYHFQASDGTNVLHLATQIITGSNIQWNHVAIRNKNEECTMFVNGVAAEGKISALAHPSGTLPAGPTTNKADMLIGASSLNEYTYGTNSSARRDAKDYSLAEIRMYDYGVSGDGITSLANSHFISGSLYQTNIAGNIFNRNGQLVVSSVWPKYHTGSGIFGNSHTWNVSWRGTHTIYENQVMVRVPKDECNISVNPSATFTPFTDSDIACDSKQSNTLPGEYRKNMFLSGSAFPYITTIGLYNKDAQLLAVGKLAQPIQKRNDVDMNFIVRWDY